MNKICSATRVVSSHGSHISNSNNSMAHSMSKPLYVYTQTMGILKDQAANRLFV